MNFKGATLMAVSQDNQILLKGDMGDDEITALANYIPQSKLEHLDLEHNRLSLLSITALANALPKTSTFKYLNLCDTAIRKEGGIILAEKVKENTSLETLLLRKNMFWKYIWDGVKLKKLEID